MPEHVPTVAVAQRGRLTLDGDGPSSAVAMLLGEGRFTGGSDELGGGIAITELPFVNVGRWLASQSFPVPALYADASRRGNASWTAIGGFAITVVIGMALLIAGAIVGGTAQVVLWVVAAAIDYAGPAWLTRERLRGLQHVAVAHFAER